MQELWQRREELAAKVKAVEPDPEDAKEDDSVPSESELKEKAANLSLQELADTLTEVKALLEDEEEDMTDEERAELTEAYLAGVERINQEQGEAAADAFHFCVATEEFARMCWGRPCWQNTGRRIKSITPGGVLDTIKKKGTGKPSQYQYGKYNFDFMPTTLGEAKHKRRKAYSSLTRWRAAALLFAVPALLPKVKNPALKKMRERKKDHTVAKGQLYRQKLKARKGS